jgi:hypothetical protein
LLQLRTCEQDVEKVHSFFYNLTFVKWIRMWCVEQRLFDEELESSLVWTKFVQL